MATRTRVLTIDVVTLSLGSVAGAICRAEPVFTGESKSLPVLNDGRVALPSPIVDTTNLEGIARLSIVPSEFLPAGWRYRLLVRKGRFEESLFIDMPDHDTDLAEATNLEHLTPIFFGLSGDAVPSGAEATIRGEFGRAEIPAFGDRHLLIFRSVSQADVTRVVLESDASQDNAIGAFTKHGERVVIPGQTVLFNVWVSNQLLTMPLAVITAS